MTNRHVRTRALAAAAVVLALAAVAATAAQSPAARPPLRVFISVDLEGIWGVVAGEQTSPGSSEYAAACRWMAQDANAAIEGAFLAGATEVVVNDSHGSMRNISPDDLDPRASLISGSPKPLSMMQGIGQGFAACLLVGYHARAGSAPAILDHTISGGTVGWVRVNGREMPELGINALVAGGFGVPVVMISGDGETCAQAAAILGDGVARAAVKEATSRFAAKLLPRPEALALIRDRARDGVARAGTIAPFRLPAPLAYELRVISSNQAELAAMVPGIERADPRTLAFKADDPVSGFRTLRALIAIASTR